MKLTYEGVEKQFRKEFKHFMDYPNVKYSFSKDKASVNFEEPYLVNEASLQEKSSFKRAMQQGIVEFRYYTFNRESNIK